MAHGSFSTVELDPVDMTINRSFYVALLGCFLILLSLGLLLLQNSFLAANWLLGIGGLFLVGLSTLDHAEGMWIKTLRLVLFVAVGYLLLVRTVFGWNSVLEEQNNSLLFSVIMTGALLLCIGTTVLFYYPVPEPLNRNSSTRSDKLANVS